MDDFENQATDQDDQQAASGNFHVELSDLPPDRRSHYLLLKLLALRQRWYSDGGQQLLVLFLSQARQRWQLYGRRVATTCLLVVLIVALLIGGIPPLRAGFLGLFQRHPAVAVSSKTVSQRVFSSVVIIAASPVAIATIAAAPSSCPRSSSLHTFDPSVNGIGVGSGPIRVAGFEPRHITTFSIMDTLFDSVPDSTPVEWFGTVVIFVKASFSGTMTLRGYNQSHAGKGVILSLDSPMISQNSSFSFNPARLSRESFTPTADGLWKNIPFYMAMQSAGCYALQASWQGGSWTAYFAAGF